MPTLRRRHAITETPQVEEALIAAQKRWPEDKDRPSRLLLHLIEEGHHAVAEAQQSTGAQRLRIIEQVSGAYTGLYPERYLDDLREDWPE